MKYAIAAMFFAFVCVSSPARAGENPDPDTVILQLDEPTGALFLIGEKGQRPVMICAAPCEVRARRDARYYVVARGKKSRPFVPGPGERVHVDVKVETSSRADVGGTVLGGTLVLVGLMEASTIPMRNDHSCGGSSWFCIPPSGWASLVDIAAVMLGSAGLITGLAFLGMTKTKVTATTSSVTWRPIIDANVHGASVGIGATF